MNGTSWADFSIVPQKASASVSMILGYFAAGKTAKEIIDEFPDLNEEHIAACLEGLSLFE
jgi:uncharacterized protein YneF (UPF0154 family)